MAPSTSDDPGPWSVTARLELLLRASEVLAGTLDWERTLHAVIDLAIPALGEFGFFDVVEGDGDGEVRRLALAKHDPRRQAILEPTRWVRSERTDLNLCALSSGLSGLHPSIGEAWLRSVAVDDGHYQLMADLGFVSMLTVPLAYEDRTFGALTLFHTIESGRRHDETDLRVAEELALRAAAAVENARLFRDAGRAIALRDEFLSIAGHELRTPLTALQLQLDGLRRAIGEAQGADDLDHRTAKALQSLHRANALVEDLLDVSRITAGRLRLERTRFALADAVAAVLERHVDEAARARCTVTQRLDPAPTGSWDRERVEQIVQNLVSNALKYGRGKPIDVTVERAGGWARLRVADQGIGIAATDQRRIFERFERAVSPRHFGGLGLGLWIVRQLVAAHGGDIRVTSEPGAGAVFELDLPLLTSPGSAP